MTLVRIVVIVAAVLVLSSGFAFAYQYKSARGLYRDCAGGVAGSTVEARIKRTHCADYLDRIFDGWILSQYNDVCTHVRRSELPKAYVEYWNERGLDLTSRLRSHAASVREFLDAQATRCSTVKPR